ncbi:MAG TPA: toll/interleukin-1 receptor domain-containing protein [Verrucomicrobiota bacterium]|nr:hypothetical protein [Verrucomicrobiales bacterium]HRI16353.1 toll/interleukin-1 receptor domain-containing protein [Verrucomicrobiota bacterium]
MPKLRFQAFLSHGSADKPTVEELARRLEREGISCWFDKWNLIPGESWRAALERGLAESETCLVFVGPSGFGPWHAEEMDLAIREGVERKPKPLRVISVLLPGGRRVADAELPGFLKGKSWVEFGQSLDEEEVLRRLVCGIHGIEPRYSPEQAPFVDQCPYVGLRPFRAEEEPFFFGREGSVRQLLGRLGNWFGTPDERRFLAVLGPSGSGKSSAVTAGLLPALAHGGLPGSDRWLYVSCKPGANPWESLQVQLGSHPEISPHLSAISEHVARGSDEKARLHLIGRYALAQSNDTRRLVVFVDQFEEVFTYARSEASDSSSLDGHTDGLGHDRRLFIENLLHAVREEQGRVCVVIALRADFYGHCALLPSLRAQVADNQVLLGPMSRSELRDAIVCPAQRGGLEVEPALVERLLDDMERQPGALPFLQHTLEQLWKAREGRRLTVAAYNQMGSLEGAVDRYAESYFGSLTSEKQVLLRHVLLDLVQLGEGSADTKRRRALRLLPGVDSTERHLFIKELADRNLVTTSRPIGETNAEDVEVELSHEALLRGWKSFQKWIDASRDQLRLRDRIEEAARQWMVHPEDESYLWQGGHLAGADDELSKGEVPLSGDGQSFLAACRELRRHAQEQERQRIQAEAARAREAEEKATQLAAARQRELEAQQKSKKHIQAFACVAVILAIAAMIASVFAWIQKARADTASANSRATATQSFIQAVEFDNTGAGSPFVDPFQTVAELYTPKFIESLDPRLRPNAWMLRALSGWRGRSREEAIESARNGLLEPAIVAGSREQVILQMIPAMVIDSDLSRKWIKAGRELSASEYLTTYEKSFEAAWRQLSGPANEGINQTTPDAVVDYFHYQRWQLILNWSAVIGSIKPRHDAVEAQERACTVLGVSQDPLFAAQKEVDQIRMLGPLSERIKAAGWTRPRPLQLGTPGTDPR